MSISEETYKKREQMAVMVDEFCARFGGRKSSVGALSSRPMPAACTASQDGATERRR